MAASRSPTEFLRRNGLLPTPPVPRPRLDPDQLRVHTLPLTDSQLDPALFGDTQGEPPPDRGTTGSWPPSQEVSSHGAGE